MDNPTANPSPVRSIGAVSTSRLEAFSDGIFAIAATLLIIEVKVPSVEDGSLGQALLDLWPSYLAYLLGFSTIGVMWVSHHFLFGLLQRIDKSLVYLNLTLLGVVAFIPFPTAVLADYMAEHSSSSLRAATIFYAVVLLMLTVSFAALWAHVRRVGDLSKDEALSRVVADRALRFCGLTVVLYLLAIALAFVLPALSIVTYGVITVLFAAGRLVPTPSP